MDTSELDYRLPPAQIAQTPREPRDAARLLVDRGPGAAPAHRTVADLPDLLEPGDLLVVNDTRVVPARLRLVKPTGGQVEVLLLERHPDGRWEALLRPGRRVAPGTMLRPPAPEATPLVVEVGSPVAAAADDGRRWVRLLDPGADGAGRGPGDDAAAELELLGRVGEVPLPPYVHEPLADAERYQTVYAARPGSVAAPTAGLHLTQGVLDRCRARGIGIATVDLVVGLGTFRPIAAERVEDHQMHAERYRVPPATIAAIDAARRVVAIGTTVVRALESWAATGEPDASTELFVHGDHQLQVVDRLLTNFHVPRSSLLALVDVFVGPRWRELYAVALAEGYRFLSFGDAMLVDRRTGPVRP